MPTNKPRFLPAAEPQLARVLASVEKLVLDDETAVEGVAATGALVVAEPKFIDITGSRLSGLVLTGSILEQLSLVDVVVQNCELSGATLSESKLLRVQFNHCRMSGIDAAGLKARDVRFNACKLDQANFRVSSWERSEFVECELQGAEFTASKLSRCQFRRSRLQQAEFSQVSVDDVSLHGSQLDGILGAGDLRGVVIGSDQVLALAVPVFAALGIEIDDEPD